MGNFRLLLLCIFAAHLTACLDDQVKTVYVGPPNGFTDGEYEIISEVLDLPQTFDDYQLDRTGGSPVIFGPGNPLNPNALHVLDAQATLGRVLFYDTQLSADQSVSCASCHQAERAFADDAAFSNGIDGQVTERNSIALGAFKSFGDEYGGGSLTGFPKSLFWDLRAQTVGEQLTATIGSDKEMGMQLSEIIDRIKDQKHYQILFGRAFDSKGDISTFDLLQALERFMQAMRADDSKFDRSLDAAVQSFGKTPSEAVKHNFAAFTTQENLGKTLFMTNCATCHQESLGFIAFGPTIDLSQTLQANNGLDETSVDAGVGGITGIPTQVGLFKIPALRNVAVSGPYMHDGRFTSLEEVVEFYSTGIQGHPNLDDRLQDGNGQPRKFNFSAEEKTALVAFLKTLTDLSTVTKERFANPWR